MKIRQGFVSNSSSSSFIIFGNKIDICVVTYNMIKKKNIYAISDEYLADGFDVFQIKTIEELAFFKALNDIGESGKFTYIDSYIMKTDYDDHDDNYFYELDVTKLPKTGKVKYINGEKDDHSSTDLKMLKSRYDEYDKTKISMQKYLRAKKLNKIEKSA